MVAADQQDFTVSSVSLTSLASVEKSPGTLSTQGTKPRTSPDFEALTIRADSGLEWAQAIALPHNTSLVTKPIQLRQAWIHRAPEHEVLRLFQSIKVGSEPIPSPWWLRALAAGTLDSRETGFRIEDRIAQLLEPRSGWEFVPWAADGESGYWEFMPSDHGQAGHTMPTTVLNTDRHTGWVDILPAHSGSTPEPVSVAGLAELRARLGEFEAVR